MSKVDLDKLTTRNGRDRGPDYVLILSHEEVSNIINELRAARECIEACDKVNKSIEKVFQYVDVTMSAGGNYVSVDFVSEQKSALDIYFRKIKQLDGENEQG